MNLFDINFDLVYVILSALSVLKMSLVFAEDGLGRQQPNRRGNMSTTEYHQPSLGNLHTEPTSPAKSVPNLNMTRTNYSDDSAGNSFPIKLIGNQLYFSNHSSLLPVNNLPGHQTDGLLSNISQTTTTTIFHTEKQSKENTANNGIKDVMTTKYVSEIIKDGVISTTQRTQHNSASKQTSNMLDILLDSTTKSFKITTAQSNNKTGKNDSFTITTAQSHNKTAKNDSVVTIVPHSATPDKTKPNMDITTPGFDRVTSAINKPTRDQNKHMETTSVKSNRSSTHHVEINSNIIVTDTSEANQMTTTTTVGTSNIHITKKTEQTTNSLESNSGNEDITPSNIVSTEVHHMTGSISGTDNSEKPQSVSMTTTEKSSTEEHGDGTQQNVSIPVISTYENGTSTDPTTSNRPQTSKSITYTRTTKSILVSYTEKTKLTSVSHAGNTKSTPGPYSGSTKSTTISMSSLDNTMTNMTNLRSVPDDEDDTYWPIAMALSIGVPTIIVVGVTITAIHRKRKLEMAHSSLKGYTSAPTEYDA